MSVDGDLRRHSAQWPERLLAIAVLLTCGYLMAMNQADPDLWGHIQYGRELIASGHLPETTTWSFTAEQTRWINHEIIAEVVLAWVMDAFGPIGLTLGKYALGLLLIGLIYGNGRRSGVSIPVMAVMCVMAAASMEFHWHFRPQIFGYLLFAVTVVILKQAFEIWQATDRGTANCPQSLRWLIALPFLMAVWVNTHGSFLAGLAVSLAVLGLRLMEWTWTATTPRHSSRRNWKTPSILCAAGGTAIAATLANPYGLEMFSWIGQALLVPRGEIQDWSPLRLLSGSREALCFLFIIATTAIAAARQQRRDWTQLIVIALVAWQTVSHIRHLPMLALVWSIWFAEPLDASFAALRRHLHSLADQHDEARQSARRPNWGRLGLSLGTLGWCLLMLVITWPRLARIEVSTARYPVQALEFIARHRLAGRTLVTFNWAQYAIGVFADQQLDSRVAFDGRFRTCYPQSVLDRYFDFLFGPDYSGPRYRSPASGRIDPEKALRIDDPELVLISRRQRPSVRTMQAQQNWTLLYQDQLAQIWGRSDLYDDVTSARYFPPMKRQVSDTVQSGSVPFPAYPGASSAELERLGAARTRVSKKATTSSTLAVWRSRSCLSRSTSEDNPSRRAR